ncbi:phosphoglycolate phosphatase [Xanthobacter sp. TB0136]|uniref:phosphoglycolate phosphatase n=1 Tax=Xanthobacter sp. TB0136 TaxID=3459177 RepID=UPI0040397474
MTRLPATIVFDLDGTLVDTAPDLLNALDAVIAPLGIAPVDREVARNFIGGGARLLVRRALESEGQTVDAARLEELNSAFLAHYAAHIAEDSRPFPGMVDALERLSAGGARLAVCTNKLEHLARQLLDALDLTRHFAAITGGDTHGVSKPDPLPLNATIAAAGGTLSRSVMVGDSLTDIRVARAAGTPVVAVSFGYTEIPPAEMGADRLIHDFSELDAAVKALLPAEG